MTETNFIDLKAIFAQNDVAEQYLFQFARIYAQQWKVYQPDYALSYLVEWRIEDGTVIAIFGNRLRHSNDEDYRTIVSFPYALPLSGASEYFAMTFLEHQLELATLRTKTAQKTQERIEREERAQLAKLKAKYEAPT